MLRTNRCLTDGKTSLYCDCGSKKESQSESRKLLLGSRIARSRQAVASSSPME
ncbi:hypothetical protein AAG906_007099 [Vitis piasezkii]